MNKKNVLTCAGGGGEQAEPYFSTTSVDRKPESQWMAPAQRVHNGGDIALSNNYWRGGRDYTAIIDWKH